MSSRSRIMSLRACCLVLAIVALQRPSLAIGAGELDPTFGTNGTVTTPIGPPGPSQMAATAYDLVIQSDGAIVVSGGADGRALLARYTTVGVLDATFGDGGIVVSSQGAPGEHFGIAQQDDGKFVAVGNDADGRADGSVARYHVDGAFDEDFGTAGFVLTTLGSVGGAFLDVALQPDGSIVTAGYARDADIHAILARYDADGALDPAFGSGGIAMPALGTSAFQGLVRQADGELVAAGFELVGSTRRMLVARFDTTGALDPTFGAEGIVTTSIGTTDAFAYAVAIAPGGTIVVSGEAVRTTDVHEVVVARYLSDGQPDASFGTDGVVTTTIGTRAYGQDVVVQPDGKTVVVGNALAGGASESFFVARYLANGAVDPDFGSGGVTTTNIGLGHAGAMAVGRQADAKIVAAASRPSTAQSWPSRATSAKGRRPRRPRAAPAP